jgi:hypothetical protein
MKHYVIIPHAGREKHLEMCLRYLVAAGSHCERLYIVVVGEITEIALNNIRKWNCWNDRITLAYLPQQPFNTDVKRPPNEPAPFWKSLLLNDGMNYVSRDRMHFGPDDWITILDSDAIVHPSYFFRDGFYVPNNVQVIFRIVRYVGEQRVADCNDVLDVYKDYDEMPLSREYPGWKTSQFSIRAGTAISIDMKWDERYYGRGFEDAAMGDALLASKVLYAQRLSPPGALLHIRHPDTPGFANDRWADRNKRLYHGTRTVWMLFDNSKDAGIVKQLTRPAGARCLLKADFYPDEALTNDIVLDCTTGGSNERRESENSEATRTAANDDGTAAREKPDDAA